MKFCKDCDYSKKEVVQVGPTQMQTILVCNNENCLNPVDASSFPCDMVRREVVFCGIAGKHFKAKEEKKEEPKTEGTVIQLK